MFSKSSKTVLGSLMTGALLVWMGAATPSCPCPGLSTPTPTPIPVSTATAIPTATATSAATATATATPTPTTLFNSTVNGNAAVLAAATYPTSFFTAAANGDISFNAAGTGSITPSSATKTVNVTINVALLGYVGRPQIQFMNASITVTAPQNTTSASLSFSFVPNTTSPLPFSVIDTVTPAAGIPYTITITQ